MPLTLDQAKARIDAIMRGYQATPAASASLLAGNLTSGKVYEAWVLSLILQQFTAQEHYQITLVGSSKVRLKSSPGPINTAYSHFRLIDPGRPVRQVWTDVEFRTLSHACQPASTLPPAACHRHELDIVVVPEGTTGWPRHDSILMGVECKNTAFEKRMMRAALGVRRELSLLDTPRGTAFRHWPRSMVPANPPSVLAVYSTDPAVAQYNSAGQVFGVDFIHSPM